MSLIHVVRVNKEFYLKVMKRLREVVRRKMPETWTNKTWMLHHDNPPPDSSLLIREFLAKQETIVVPQPLLSRFGPCGLFPVPKVEVHHTRSRFQTVEEIKENSLQDLRAIPQNVPGRVPELKKKVGSGVSTVEGSILKETSLIKL